MRVVINQPNYVPWHGYFDLIDDADLFFFHDDVKYTKQDWRNRNRIKTRGGVAWLTVPVVKAPTNTLIKDVLINYAEAWPATHQRMIIDAYGKSVYFKKYAEDFFAILEKHHERLVDLNIETTRFFMKVLGITTPTRLVSGLNLSGNKTGKLIGIMQGCKGTEYLSGPAAKAYIEEDKFADAGISLTWKNYDYAPYPQLWGEFEPQVSVLDLLFNCGPEARRYLKSTSPGLAGVSRA
jgi:hypothetical protein